MLHAALGKALGDLALALDLEAAQDPIALRKLRVGLRRLRSLAKPLREPSREDPISIRLGRLKALQDQLSGKRDQEVIEAWLGLHPELALKVRSRRVDAPMGLEVDRELDPVLEATSILRDWAELLRERRSLSQKVLARTFPGVWPAPSGASHAVWLGERLGAYEDLLVVPSPRQRRAAFLWASAQAHAFLPELEAWSEWLEVPVTTHEVRRKLRHFRYLLAALRLSFAIPKSFRKEIKVLVKGLGNLQDLAVTRELLEGSSLDLELEPGFPPGDRYEALHRLGRAEAQEREAIRPILSQGLTRARFEEVLGSLLG